MNAFGANPHEIPALDKPASDAPASFARVVELAGRHTDAAPPLSDRMAIKAPDLKPENIVKGQMDQAGREIRDVYWISKSYAIYRWKKSTDEQSFFGMPKKPSFSYGIAAQLGDEPKQRECYAKIGPDLAQICALQKGALSAKDPVNCEIARCISLTLEGFIDDAKPILAALHQRLQAMRDTEDRAYYLVILTLAAATAVAICILLSMNFPHALTALFPQLPLVLLFGVLGGYFSVLTKINKLCLDPEASRSIMAVSAATRVLAAMVGAFAVYTFILSTFGKTLINAEMLGPTGFATICIFAFLAGFSENFVPGLFNVLDQRAGRQSVETQSTPAAPPDTRPTQRNVRGI